MRVPVHVMYVCIPDNLRWCISTLHGGALLRVGRHAKQKAQEVDKKTNETIAGLGIAMSAILFPLASIMEVLAKNKCSPTKDAAQLSFEMNNGLNYNNYPIWAAHQPLLSPSSIVFYSI